MEKGYDPTCLDGQFPTESEHERMLIDIKMKAKNSHKVSNQAQEEPVNSYPESSSSSDSESSSSLLSFF